MRSEFDSDNIDEMWTRLEASGNKENLVVEEVEEEEEPDNEPRCSYDEDKLLYWARLDQEGLTVEEMLSQGLISVDSYPYFDDQPKEPEEPVAVAEIVLRDYTPEELDQLEIVYF
jgi:hypothetical protein